MLYVDVDDSDSSDHESMLKPRKEMVSDDNNDQDIALKCEVEGNLTSNVATQELISLLRYDSLGMMLYCMFCEKLEKYFNCLINALF